MNRKLIITISLLIALATVLAIVPVQAAADISAIFDADYYINSYWDLKGMTAEQAKVHFMNWGIKEGRCASASFDVKYYVANNWDLAGMDYVTAASHYLQWGVNENRKTVDEAYKDFDAAHYIANNWDLAGMSAKAAYDHYMKYGKNENRKVDDHVFVAYGDPITAPTCEKEGTGAYKCKAEGCEEGKIASLPVVDHDFSIELDDKVESTCATKGTVTKLCSMCKRATTVEEFPLSTEHKFMAGDVIKEATCVAEGLQKVVCYNCGIEETAVIEATGVHTPGEAEVTEATCEADGMSVKHCTVCNEVVENKKVEDKLEHNWRTVKVVREVSCKNGIDGLEEQICTRCNKTRTNTIKAEHNIDIEAANTESYTCSEESPKPGEVTAECAVCHETVTVKYETGKHTWGEPVVTEPTCENPGSKVYTCEVCGETKTEEIAATEHNFEKTATGAIKYTDGKAPTCTETATAKCLNENCDADENMVTIEALGHKYPVDTKGNPVYDVEPTCTTLGKTHCLNGCEAEGKAGSVEVANSYVGNDKGNTTGVHAAGEYEVTVEADCATGKAGTKVKKCVYCGKVMETVEVLAEHTFETFTSSDGSVSGKRCSKCGIVACPSGHTKVVTEGTCEAAGHVSCSVCGTILEESELTEAEKAQIAKKDHNIVGQVATNNGTEESPAWKAECKDCGTEVDVDAAKVDTDNDNKVKA